MNAWTAPWSIDTLANVTPFGGTNTLIPLGVIRHMTPNGVIETPATVSRHDDNPVHVASVRDLQTLARERRKSLDLTQDALATRMGVSRK